MEKIFIYRPSGFTLEAKTVIWNATENNCLTEILPAAPVKPLKGRGYARYKVYGDDLAGINVVPAAHKTQIWESDRGANKRKVWVISPEVAEIYAVILGAI